MNKTDVIGIVIALWTSGILTAVVHAGVKLINANTKNKRLIAFNTWLDQAVQYAENTANTPTTKKRAAEDFLVQRLFANNVDRLFSPEQINAGIEQAVAKLHDWHPEIKEK